MNDDSSITNMEQDLNKVNSNAWDNKTVNQLQEDLLVLFNRLNIAQTLGKHEMVKDISTGISIIEAQIQRKLSGKRI